MEAVNYILGVGNLLTGYLLTYNALTKEHLAAIKDIRAKGLKPLGNWHSHPESPSRPSQEDKRLAYDSSASYLILSLQDRENPVLNSFHIEGDNATNEGLVIT